MTVEELKQAIAGGLPVVDIRQVRSYAESHIPGTVSFPFHQSEWADLLSRYIGERPILLFGDNAKMCQTAHAAWQAGGGNISAVWDRGMGPWIEAGWPSIAVDNLTVDQLHRILDQVTVVDVRESYEWRTGIIAGAKTIPLGHLADRVSEIPKERMVAVVCAHGHRSLSGAALLADHGYHAGSLLGGMALWLGAGYATDRYQ